MTNGSRTWLGIYLSVEAIINLIDAEIAFKLQKIAQLKSDAKAWPYISISQKIALDVGMDQYESEIIILRKKKIELLAQESVDK
jgi:hypothetical protein